MVRRFGLYFIGIALGTALSFAIFGSRSISCSYFPNDRVLTELHRKPIRGADSAVWSQVGSDCTVLKAFLTLGEVDFTSSKTRTRHKANVPAYWIDLEFRELTWRGLWEVREDSAWLVALKDEL